jgi:hypothetical protein
VGSKVVPTSSASRWIASHSGRKAASCTVSLASYDTDANFHLRENRTPERVDQQIEC